MSYFENIQSLADLKKRFRNLAKANHPDRGGSTETMQKINVEFEKLYDIWKDRPATQGTASGYENDFTDATAREYTQHVYNEYKFTGRHYNGQSVKEVTEIIRDWLKKTYPGYKFSLTRWHYSSIVIKLLEADFEAFIDKSKRGKQLNVYWLHEDKELTDRAREVMVNIRDFANSYNFDDSDMMTDYFHVHFYLNIEIGSDSKPYKIVIPKSRRTRGETVPQFTYPEGPVHKAVRLAQGDAIFSQSERRDGMKTLLGKISYSEDGRKWFYPLCYSAPKTAQKRIEKLQAAGIVCRMTNSSGNGYVEFLGYTDATLKALCEEDRQREQAKAAWEAEHGTA